MSTRPDRAATAPAKPAGRGPAPFRPLRTRAWWVMRECGVFDLHELLLTVADGTERAAAENLRRYIRELGRAAVVTRAPARPGAWRLASDLGPIPPVARRATAGRPAGLYDPNTGQWLQRAAAETPDTDTTTDGSR